MASSARKSKQAKRAARLHVRISFSSKNPRAKPTISAQEARRLVTEIEDFGRTGVAEAQACTIDSCREKVRGVKAIAAKFGRTLSCKYACKWFYSKGGGWQKECYFVCNDGKGVTLEGTA